MKKAKKRKSQTRIAMVRITFVAGVLFLGMLGKSVALQKQLSAYDSQIKELDQQIEEEEGRTTEIDDLKGYMKTDEYVEETAREKLGLVKENEIVFKEGESQENSQDTDGSQSEENVQEAQSSQWEDSREVQSSQTRSSSWQEEDYSEEEEG